MAKSARPILGPGMVTVRILVANADVVLVRALLEARDGLGIVFAEKGSGGDLLLATTESQKKALDDFVIDLATEIDLRIAG